VISIQKGKEERKSFISKKSPDEIIVLIRMIERLREASQDIEPFLRDLADKTENDEELRLLKIANLRRKMIARQEILKDCITTTDVVDILGVSKQSIHKRLQKGYILSITSAGKIYYPLWQFDPSQKDGFVKGLIDIVKEMHVPPISIIYWFILANTAFEGRRPIDVLREGYIDQVRMTALAVGAFAL
jgi:hypothetical protein